MFTVLRSPAHNLYEYGTSKQAASIFRIIRIILRFCETLESNGRTAVTRAAEKSEKIFLF